MNIKFFLKKINLNFFLILFIILIILSRIFLYSFYKVNGESMFPTLKDKQIIVVNKYSKEYNYNDIIVFKNKENNELFIKRVIGLPNDTITIKNNKLYRNNKLVEESYLKEYVVTLGEINVKVPSNKYFVLGDNRVKSLDSRVLGCISKKDIIGKVF